MRPPAAAHVGAALRVVAQRLGGTWVKAGQLVASIPDLVVTELADELRPLLDTAPPVPLGVVRRIVEKALDRPFRSAFTDIDPLPVGTGSLAVVHRGVTTAGRTVALKVLRPGIERNSAADLVLIERLIGQLASWGGIGRRPVTFVVDSLREQLGAELDLREEARAMARFSALFRDAGLTRVTVPDVLEDLTARRVLTMEFIEGVAVDDLSAIEQRGLDPRPLIDEAVRAWWTTTAVEGVFHGDVHAGNLLLTTDGRLGLIDWGIVGTLDPATLRLMRLLVSGAAGEEASFELAAAALVDQMPDRARRRSGLDDDQLRAMAGRALSYALTRPYGEVSLGSLLTGEALGEGAVADRSLSPRRAAAGLPGRRSARARGQRRGGPAPVEEGTVDEGGLDRTLFLLGKQLLYFERYGKRYLADRPILGDTASITRLLEGREAGDP
ncbi:MAG TPA: AarF/ABC1/UbiB kinase family protein [Acidimicrobiales bacterium]|nr:AarF/ABC1/UbiB kinase family protein [Acidimicrobiales bacterium]